VAMDDPQELQEGWQAHDLRSGVAKVYHEAKQRSTTGVRVAASWAIVMVVYGILAFAGEVNVSPSYIWDSAAGFGAILLAALSVSRTPGPMLGAALLVLADVAAVSYNLPDVIDRANVVDHVGAAVRLVVAIVALLFILTGYVGSLSIEAFKNGFSPGADWRTRISPKMLQFVVAGSFVTALVMGLGSWAGAIKAGFAQTGAVPLKQPKEQPAPKPAAEESFSISPFAEKEDKPFVYPESAVPIDNVQGLDVFMRQNVDEAYEWAAGEADAACLIEAHGRQDRCRDDRCRYWARVFARACLSRAKKTEHFCDDVPEVTAVVDGNRWAERRCAGRNPETCREMLFTMQGHCHPPPEEIVRSFFPNRN
jgi:hypothetical protein